MPDFDDAIEMLDIEPSRFDNPDLPFMPKSNIFIETQAVHYIDEFRFWAVSQHRRSHPFAQDKISQLLLRLAERLTEHSTASREAELHKYAIPLNEAMKAATIEYPSISIDPKVMAGAPCIVNTRIPVYMVLDALEGYGDVDAAITSYPTLTIQQVKDAIGFAKLVVECPVEHEAKVTS